MYETFWSRKLTLNRVALNTYPVHIIRQQDRAYNKISHDSRLRLERLLILAEYIGANHYEFPEKVFTTTPAKA